MTPILAIDGGGSKCQALLVSHAGQVLGTGMEQTPGQSGRSLEAIILAAGRALGANQPEAVWVVSVTNARPAKTAVGRLGLQVKGMHFVLEREAALALAGESCGVVLLSGTGAFVFGRARDGRELVLDGLGPVLGDIGSAYYIGLMGMRAAAKSEWHPRFQTSLHKQIYRFYGLKNLGDLIKFSLAPKDRSVVAAFAKIVNAEAEAGDAMATHIMRKAAEDLAEVLGVVLERLAMAAEPYPLIATGSVISAPIFWQRLCERVREVAPRLTLKRLVHPLVLGIALLGLKHFYNLGGTEVTAKLLASYAAWK